MSGALVPEKVTGNLVETFDRAPPVAAGLSAVDSTPHYYLTRARLPGDIVFTRASTGVATGGGSEATFAANVPRSHDSRLFLDAGGTNIVVAPTDFTDAAWAKTNVGTPTLTTGPGGANTAYALRETVDNGLHRIGQSITGLAAEDQFTAHWLVKPVGRDYAAMQILNAGTGKAVTGRLSFLTGQFLTGYPAGTGGAGAVDGGIVPYGDGWYLVWLTTTFDATETGIQVYCGTMSDSSTTSFVGDTAQGLDVAGMWALAGAGAPVNFLTGTRAAETLELPLAPAWYLARRVDGIGEVIHSFEIATEGDRWNLAPRDGGFWLTEAQAYNVALLDDTSTQADNSDGDTVTPTFGPDLVPYKNTGGQTFVTATNGRIASGKYEITPQAAVGGNNATYWVVDLGEGSAAKFVQGTLHLDAATAGGDALSNMAFIIGFSSSLTNLTENMLVHVNFDADGFRGQYGPADALVTRSHLLRKSNPGDSTDVSVALHGDKLTVTMFDESITVQDAAFSAADARYAFFELYSTSNNTTRTIRFSDPVVSLAEIGPAPSYTAAVPTNIAAANLPFASGVLTAGETFTIIRGYWASNDGPIVSSQQWQFDGVNIGGATSVTYVTTNGVDEGKMIRVGDKATNDTGASAFAYSAARGPLV